MSVESVYICDAHGVSITECCEEAKSTGWIERSEPEPSVET